MGEYGKLPSPRVFLKTTHAQKQKNLDVPSPSPSMVSAPDNQRTDMVIAPPNLVDKSGESCEETRLVDYLISLLASGI